MKYIFDFDDVLFHTTKSLKERIYEIYAKNGISRERIKDYVTQEDHLEGFSLKKLLRYFSLPKELYDEIMNNSKDFVNRELLETIKKIGRENCYIVTCGDEEFQKDKIKKAELETFFREIIVVLVSKKEAVEKICKKHEDEPVLFIDDKASHFADLDFKKYPNLKTILYTGQNLESYLQ